MGAVETGLNECVAAIVSGLGYEFVGCEWHRDARQSSLRIYIDKEGGVTVTDCTAVSRQVGAVLDVEDRVRGHYCLEVSSPGINRPLFSPAQYQQHIGQVIHVRLREPYEGRRQLKGTLSWVTDEAFCVQTDEGERTAPLACVARAHLVVEIFPAKNDASRPAAKGQVKRG